MLKPNQQLPAQLPRTLICLWAAGAISLLTSVQFDAHSSLQDAGGLVRPAVP